MRPLSFERQLVAQFHIIAEALRAYVEANDVTSHWPRATRARLKKIDPGLYEYVERIFLADFQFAA